MGDEIVAQLFNLSKAKHTEAKQESLHVKFLWQAMTPVVVAQELSDCFD